MNTTPVNAGGKADKAGGPLDRDGEVGHQFTTDGAVGETLASL